MPLVQLQQSALQGSISKYPDSAGQGSGHGTRGGKVDDPSWDVDDDSGSILVSGAAVVVCSGLNSVDASWAATMATTRNEIE